MRSIKRSVLVAVGAVLLLAAGFFVGVRYEEGDSKQLLLGVQEQNLSNTLMVLRYLDRKEVGEATKLLEASTSGALAWIMESDRPTAGSSLCATLNTLKAYRERHQLFTGERWADYRSLPGIEGEERKRSAYLEGLSCGTGALYKID